MRDLKKTFVLLLVSVLFVLAVSSSINLVHAQVYNYYQFNGPYYLNTQQNPLASTSVIINALYVNGSVYSFTLAGNQIEIYSSSPIKQISWNASSSLNYTSLIDFTPNQQLIGVFNSINIFIPNPNSPFFQYTFPVTDFVGVTNAYLQMSVNTSTSNSAMTEQVSLSAASTPTFVMQQYQTYTLSFICDQGTYSEQFTAEATYVNSLTIFPGMFGVNNATQRTINSYATNNTNIYVTYQDPTSQTSWVNFIITENINNNNQIDYNYTASASTASINWNSADTSTTAYTVTITDLYQGTTETYIYNIAAAPSTNNPFTSISGLFGQLPLSWTGGFISYLPFDASQAIAIALIMVALCVGSYFSMALGCGLSWVVGVFLWYVGWWQAAVGPIILGGILVGFIIFIEAKKREREF